MFGLFKDAPAKKLEKAYYKKLEEAMHAQRNGDIRSYSMLTAEAETMRAKMQQIQTGS